MVTGALITMRDDDPITLKEACEIVFRNTCAVATLRAEADRGRLNISKIGKRYYTTLRSARELYEKCRVDQKGRDYTLIPRDVSGLYVTVQGSSARAALKAELTKPEGSSGSIWQPPTSLSHLRRR